MVKKEKKEQDYIDEWIKKVETTKNNDSTILFKIGKFLGNTIVLLFLLGVTLALIVLIVWLLKIVSGWLN